MSDTGKVRLTVVDPETRNAVTTEYGAMELVSDGFHTFKELYHYRMLYNAAFFNELEKNYDTDCAVHKSWRHSDGELCFGGGWFVVVAHLPTGQITNHYRKEHWGLFHIPEHDCAETYDGHTPAQTAERLERFVGRGF